MTPIPCEGSLHWGYVAYWARDFKEIGETIVEANGTDSIHVPEEGLMVRADDESLDLLLKESARGSARVMFGGERSLSRAAHNGHWAGGRVWCSLELGVPQTESGITKGFEIAATVVDSVLMQRVDEAEQEIQQAVDEARQLLTEGQQ